jgi:multidrug efflux pump subunit AcrA (membrane-fusion protein)
MQTHPAPQMFPAAPDVRVVRETNWTAVIIVGVVTFILLAASILVIRGKAAELGRTKADLASVNATLAVKTQTLASTKASLDQAKASLQTTQSDLQTARQDLASKQRALQASVRCNVATLAAWYSTTNYTYDFTGRMLQRAVYSGSCRIARQAYLSATGSSS